MRMVLLVLSLFVLSQSSFGQYSGEPSDENSNNLRRQGQFLSLILVPGEPLKIFVVGKEEAQVDLSTVKLTVRRLHPYPGKILKVDRFQNYFVISDPLDRSQTNDLEIKATIKTKTDMLNFKLHKRIP